MLAHLAEKSVGPADGQTTTPQVDEDLVVCRPGRPFFFIWVAGQKKKVLRSKTLPTEKKTPRNTASVVDSPAPPHVALL